MWTFFSGLATYSGGGAVKQSHVSQTCGTGINIAAQEVKRDLQCNPSRPEVQLDRSCNSFIQMHICGAAREFHRGEDFQRGRSCKSPDSRDPATDTCGHGTACRSTHFGGTGQPGYRHRYLWRHIDCQVNCTRGHVKGLYTQSTRSVSGEAGGPSKGVNAQMHRCLPETPIIWTCTCHKHICYRYPGPYPAGQELSLEADLTHEQLPSIAQFIHRKSRTSQSGTKLRECSVLGGSVPTAQSKPAQL